MLSLVPRQPATDEPPSMPSKRSLRGLDWFVFCVADVQTGFGPFVAVYLTTQKWTQVDIGLVLSVARPRRAGRADAGRRWSSMPRVRAAGRRRLRSVAIARARWPTRRWPIFPAVLAAAVAACGGKLRAGPGIAAISLGLVGHAAIGERLGRNARFASIGNGLAAAAMGACGYFFSARAVFFVTAVLLVPTLLALQHDPAARDRPRAGAWRRARSRRPGTRARFRHPAAPASAADPRRLHHAVPSRQRRHAAADGQRADDALERMGDGADRGLHRRAAARRRRDLAVGRAAGRILGPAVLCCCSALPRCRSAACCSPP